MEYPAGRNKAIIAYITIIGMLIAISMNSDNKEYFATCHIKNMLGLTIIWFSSQVITFYINPYVGDALFLISLILVIYSATRAYKGLLPNIPVLSPFFMKWFTGLD